MKKTIYTLIASLTLNVLGSFLLISPIMAVAPYELLKSDDFGTVYYVDSHSVRHAFPNEITYRSWYGTDFSGVTTVSSSILENYPLGNNITIRQGTYLVKIRTASEVYAVEQGGVLRQLENESIAEGVYGEDWVLRVVDVPDVFFDDYTVGDPIIHDYTVPEDILYKDTGTETYFYKNAGILRQFESTADVLANNFDLSFALSNNRSYFIRSRNIVGRDKNVFNPVAEPIVDRRDCSNTGRAAINTAGPPGISSRRVTSFGGNPDGVV